MSNEKEAKVFEYDIEKAKELILSEGYEGPILANARAENIRKLHPDVWPAVKAWLNGEYLEREYQGITFELIMKKEKTTYIDAIFCMSTLMKHPEIIPHWKQCSFRRL